MSLIREITWNMIYLLYTKKKTNKKINEIKKKKEHIYKKNILNKKLYTKKRAKGEPVRFPSPPSPLHSPTTKRQNRRGSEIMATPAKAEAKKRQSL